MRLQLEAAASESWRLMAPRSLPTSKSQPDGTSVKALACAWRWQRMLDEGVYATVSEIGDAKDISKSYASRILLLALLAPDIGLHSATLLTSSIGMR